MSADVTPIRRWKAPRLSVQRRADKCQCSGRSPLPALDDVGLETLRADQLRLAIRSNLVTFPSQIPVFERHDRPDLQRRIVQLYFVFGWSCTTIAARYGMVRQRIGQVLNTWKRRAIETGYLQVIPSQQNTAILNTTLRVVLYPVVCTTVASITAAGEKCSAIDPFDLKKL